MSDDHKVTKISLDEFTQLGSRQAGQPSWQRIKIENMEADTALRLSHEGLVHKGPVCGGRSVVVNLKAKFHERMYSMSHADNGDLLIARYADKVDASQTPSQPVTKEE